MQNQRNDILSIREYLSKMKTYCDLFEVVGHKVSDNEQILSIIKGLDEENESVTAIILAKETTPTLQYVHATLLAHEGIIEQRKPLNSEMSINFVSQSRRKKSKQRVSKSNSGNSNQNYQSGGLNSKGRGRGGRFNNRNRPRCQICERCGHTALKCYFRLDLSYTPNSQSVNNNQRNYNPTANLSRM